MRKTLVILVAAMMVGMTIPAFAELQNVQVGGSLRIRGNWYNHDSHIPLSFDDERDSLSFEQRTKVNVNADFTDDVHAFIELDSYNIFGDDFRGLDSAGGLYGAYGSGNAVLNGFDNGNGTPVSFYQGYIEMRESWGYPITVRIGRSEFQQGDEFLIGNNDTSSNFRGLSFDGVWASYNNENFNVGAFWTRPFTDGTGEESGDINFSGIHGEYTGIENMSIGAYYYYYHGASLVTDVGPDSQAFHTIGARFAGNSSQFDWAVNGAYQTGDTAFPTVEVNAFAVQAALGYTFDINMQPRIFVHGAYYGGPSDNLDEAAFNRMFSDHEYSEFIDSTDLSNFWMVGGGVSAQVTESINLKGLVHWFNVVEDFGSEDSDLGLEAEIIVRYNYSEDLYFEAGYAHFFTGDGISDGQLVSGSGAFVLGGGADDDLDYVYIETGIKF